MTCATCVHFLRSANKPVEGWCYLNPPTVFPSGYVARPIVQANDKECSYKGVAQDVRVEPVKKKPQRTA